MIGMKLVKPIPHSHMQSVAFANPAMLTSLRRSNLLLKSHVIVCRKAFSCAMAVSASSSHYSAASMRNLFSRISPVKDDEGIVDVLDQWVAEGRKLNHLEFQRIIRDLRTRKRFSQALQVSEWISRNHVYELSSGDLAVHLSLIGIVHGCEVAECFFNNLKDKDKNEKTYGAMLNCYSREGLLEKTLVHIQKMKDSGYALSCLDYNNLMALYKTAGLHEKIPKVLEEMRNTGVAPNNFSYRICIDSFGERSYLNAIEALIGKIELDDIDWKTYSAAAFHCIKGNDKEKALTYMKKLEEKVQKDALAYNHLISLYAHLGNKDEMMRLWALQKIACKKQINRDYISMLGSLVKLGELETAEVVLKEWDVSYHTFDFRVPNVLLIGYCQNGLIEKAERMLRDIVRIGKKPRPNSWSIIAAAYSDKGSMEKAYECLNKAIDARECNIRWVPKPDLILKILDWLGAEGDVKEIEAFLKSVKTVAPINREMHTSLIEACRRAGREVGWILDSMKVDEIVIDDEIQSLLSSS